MYTAMLSKVQYCGYCQPHRKPAKVGMLPVERALDRSWTEQIPDRPSRLQWMKRLLSCDNINERKGGEKEGRR